jgi:hypothetical protein
MKLSWNDIANIGIDESVNPSEVRHIHLVNVLAIFIAIFEFGILAAQFTIWHVSNCSPSSSIAIWHSTSLTFNE